MSLVFINLEVTSEQFSPSMFIDMQTHTDKDIDFDYNYVRHICVCISN